MIVVLGIVLLILTFIQSVLVLKSDDNKNSKTLSWLYFFALIIGIIVLCIDDSEKKIVNEYVNKTSKQVDNLNKLVDSQFVVINKNLNNSNEILNKSDSLNNVIIALTTNHENLLNQYKLINKKFKDELYLENIKLQERTAIIENDRSKISWDTTSNNTCALKICVNNIGLRNAIIQKGKGYIIFFKNNQIKGSLPIPGNSLGEKLEPKESYCYYSHGIINYSEILDSVDYVIIMLEVKYTDILLINKNISKSYTIWMPNQGFGGPKDWQVNLARNWEKTNFNF